MAEPRTSLHTWKRGIILLVVVLVNILPYSKTLCSQNKKTTKWLHSSFKSTKICRSRHCKFSSG